MIDALGFDHIEVGRRLGHDLFRFKRTNAQGDWPSSVVEGYVAALRHGGIRETADRFTKKWLQLRVGAYRRGRFFDEQVTPEFLKLIDVEECPVLRIRLTYGERLPSDWSIDRINNKGAYALHNLAVISSFANTAKSRRSFDDVFALAQRTIATDGLSPEQWMRLASVMLGPCFIESPDHVPIIPLTAPISPLTARFPVQIIQQLVSLMAKSSSGKNVLIKHFKGACTTEYSKNRLVSMIEHAHSGLKMNQYPWDIWLSDRMMQALITWHGSLDVRGQDRASSIAQSISPTAQVSISKMNAWRLPVGG